MTEKVSISNLGNYDAYARLYLQSIFDVTNPDSVKDIVTAQTAETVLTGTISYQFVRRNAVDTDWDSAPFEIGGATHLRVTYDPDGTAEPDYNDPNTRNHIILYVAFGEQFMRGHAFNVWLNHEFLPNNPDYMWIKEVNTSAVKRSIDDANHAFQKFFKKKASDVKMYFYRKNSRDCECERHRLKIPSLGWVRLKEKGYIPTTASGVWVKSGRISKRAGRYFVSVLLDMPDKPTIAPAEMTDGIGLHLSIRELALTSTGIRFDNINKTDAVRKLEKRLRREHRLFSRKLENEKQGGQTQGRNIEKQKLKLQRLYWKISNIRDNYIDQT